MKGRPLPQLFPCHKSEQRIAAAFLQIEKNLIPSNNIITQSGPAGLIQGVHRPLGKEWALQWTCRAYSAATCRLVWSCRNFCITGLKDSKSCFSSSSCSFEGAASCSSSPSGLISYKMNSKKLRTKVEYLSEICSTKFTAE